MNRKYEGLIILNATQSRDGVDELVSQVAREMESEGAQLDEVKQLGRYKFAHQSGKLDGGHYVNYLFSAKPEILARIEERLSGNDLVHLQHYQRRH